MKVLVLGASGMLGFAVHRTLHDSGYDVTGSLRGASQPQSKWCSGLKYAYNCDAETFGRVAATIEQIRPTTVINAIGLKSGEPTEAGMRRMLTVNSMLPKLLAVAAEDLRIHLIHFSTDGVFSGRSGPYSEGSFPDPEDLYGMSKYLGEPEGPRSLVIRTSIIGRGLDGNDSLVDWLLCQRGTVRGYRRAVFSGLPVNEIAGVLGNLILPRPAPLTGLFNLAAAPIDKFNLLNLLRDTWSLDRVILEPDDKVVINRSLVADRLNQTIGYEAPGWTELVSHMYTFYEALEVRPGR